MYRIGRGTERNSGGMKKQRSREPLDRTQTRERLMKGHGKKESHNKHGERKVGLKKVYKTGVRFFGLM